MTEVPIEASPSTSARAVRLPEIARIFLNIGAMSYGVGIIGIMQSEVQEKRQWIGKEEFVEGLAFAFPNTRQYQLRTRHKSATWAGCDAQPTG